MNLEFWVQRATPSSVFKIEAEKKVALRKLRELEERKLKEHAGHCDYCYNGNPMPPNPNDEESYGCDYPQW